MGILRATIAASLILYCCGCVKTLRSPSSATTCDTDDAILIQAALEYEVAYKDRLTADQFLVMYDTTVVPRIEEEGDISRYVRGTAALSLVERNREEVTLSSFPNINRILFVTKAERIKLFPPNNNDGQNSKTRALDDAERVWQKLYGQFPKARGLINVSLPGYDTNNCEALIYLTRQGGPLAAEGVLIWLKWRNDRWVVVDRQVPWKR